jgi:flagellar motor switch protein FliM
MPDTLSQEEIDALREAVSSGADLGGGKAPPPPEEQIKVTGYDFRKPRLISIESLHVVELLHQEAAKAFDAYLLAALKQNVAVKLATMDQITYAEFTMASVAPTYLVRVDAAGLGAVSIEIGMPIILAMLDIILGGTASAAHERARELTPLEKKILERLVIGLIERMQEAWLVVAKLDMKVADVVANSEYLQAATPETPCLNLCYDVSVGADSSLLSICYPISIIQAALKVSDQKDAAVATGGAGMLRAMGKVPLRVKVVLGNMNILAEDLGKLEVGDIVCMEKGMEESVEVCVGDTQAFSAHLGRRKDKLAVELLGYRSTN